jgi:hypothetical protein
MANWQSIFSIHKNQIKMVAFLALFSIIGVFFILRIYAAVAPNIANGDLNNDGKVDVSDLSILLSNYGSTNAVADINGDAVVNVIDLSILLSHYGSTTSSAAWTTVINDNFDSGTVPTHWHLYDAPYGSGPHNCAVPSHVTVSGGFMHMLMQYETTGQCNAGWYTAGMQIDKAFGAIDQRTTVRFRVVNGGVQSHRIIPMRWPDTAPWPSGGEEDFCEGSSLTGCTTFLHYGTTDTQVSHDYVVDLTQWHTVRFERLNHIVKAYIDDMTTPVWTYTGSATTLPDTVKRAVLQQECRTPCPAGTTGTEDIQIDWITIENPS